MTKYYNAETRNSLEMQFGGLVQAVKKLYVYPKRIDKRTKKYGNQRKHNGVIEKYN
jgi:hypothetical protein